LDRNKSKKSKNSSWHSSFTCRTRISSLLNDIFALNKTTQLSVISRKFCLWFYPKDWHATADSLTTSSLINVSCITELFILSLTIGLWDSYERSCTMETSLLSWYGTVAYLLKVMMKYSTQIILYSMSINIKLTHLLIG
jgi:hypothetical protein